MTNVSLVILLLAPLLGQMGDEFYQDFRRGPLHPALGQFGPDAARVIQPAPDGLRIVLLAKRPEPGGVGVTPQILALMAPGSARTNSGSWMSGRERPSSGGGSYASAAWARSCCSRRPRG
jgi:hypothetical protein